MPKNIQDENNNVPLLKRIKNEKINDFSFTFDTIYQDSTKIIDLPLPLSEYRFNVRKDLYKMGMHSFEKRCKALEKKLKRKLTDLELIKFEVDLKMEFNEAAELGLINNIPSKKILPLSFLEWKDISKIFQVIDQGYQHVSDKDFLFLSPNDYNHCIYQIQIARQTTPEIGNKTETNFFIEPIIRILAKAFEKVLFRAGINFKSELLPFKCKADYCLVQSNRKYFIIKIINGERRSNIEKLEKGMAQSFTAMEVMVEKEKMDKIYGIVTNFYNWRFLQITNEGTCYYSYKPHTVDEFPTDESLKELVLNVYVHMKKSFGEGK